MKKTLFISTFALATAATTAALACGGEKGAGMRARIDTNGDGKITLAESQAAAKARFERLDANKNGVVTQDELKGRGRFLMKADQNGDGQVTLAEAQAKAKEFFAKRDANKDNVLSDDELRRGFGHAKKDKPRS